MSRPLGLLHWAGAELSALWNGYMDGAVRSGEQVAGDVLAALAAEPVPAPAGASAALPDTSR